MVPPARGRVRAATGGGGGGGAARLRPGGRVAGRAGGRPRSPAPAGPGRRARLSAGRGCAAAPAPGVGLPARTPGLVYLREGIPETPVAAQLFCAPA